MSDRLLGGTSLVVPAGTTVVVPGTALEWQGFNTASLKAHVAGLAGGDTFKVYAAVIDPEDPALPVLQGFPLPTLLEASGADGDYAGTLNLPGFFGGSGTQVLRPYLASTNSIAWGHPGQADFVDGYNNFPPGTNRFTRGLGAGGILAAALKMSDLTDPGIDTDFFLYITMLSTMNDATSRLELHSSVPGHANLTDFFFGNPGYVGVLPPTSGGVVTGSFVEYVMPFDASEAAHINFVADMQFVIEYGGVVFSGSPNPTWDVTNLRFECPGVGGGGGGADAMIPFYYNKLVLDATACAGDITLSHALLELTIDRPGFGGRLV